jgi:hypothetical protein
MGSNNPRSDREFSESLSVSIFLLKVFDKDKYSLGRGFVLAFSGGEKMQCKLLQYDQPIKVVDLSDKVAKKLLVIEAIQLGVIQSHLADALEISRQTIHNYLETHKYFGIQTSTP